MTLPRSNSLKTRDLQEANDPPFELGEVLTTGHRFQMAWQHIAVHMAVLGGSGSGKSKFLELLLRNFLVDGRGFCYIDPHGDTAHDLLAFAAAKKAIGDDELWRRVHYLQIGPDCAVSYDPFAHAPLRSAGRRIAYDSWLDTKVDRVCRAILRRVAEADLETMNRLKRWLKNILFACGVAVDDNNTHVGMDQMLVFTNPEHPEFESLLELVAPFLPDYVLADFRMLQSTKRAQDREKWVESTINRLRDFLSVLIREVLGQRAPSINIPEIIRTGGCLVTNLGQTPHWGHDHKVTLGGLLIDEVLLAKEAEENRPPEERVPFALVIDESGEFLGEDLQRALGATRKYELAIVLAAQDLSTFAKGDFDMAPKVLSMCQTVVCFQQTYRKDKEILADRLGAGNLDFTERLQEVQRQRGWIEKQMEEHSYGDSHSRTWNKGKSASETKSQNEVISEMISVMRGHAHMRGQSLSRSHTDARGDAQSDGATVTRGVSPIIVRGEVVGVVPTVSKGEQVTGSVTRSSADGTVAAENSAATDTTAQTIGNGRAVGTGSALTTGSSLTEGGAVVSSHNVALKTTILPNLVSEMERTGQLDAGTIAEQFERMMQQLHTLSVAEAIVCPRNVKQSFPVQIARVEEWWETGAQKARAIERIKERLRALRTYYFRPGEAGDAVVPEDDEAPEPGVDRQRGRTLLDPPAEEKNPFDPQ